MILQSHNDIQKKLVSKDPSVYVVAILGNQNLPTHILLLFLIIVSYD
jgi:hypothetical protein